MAVVTGHLPGVDVGTVLRLAKGEWSAGDQVPAETHAVIRVAHIHIKMEGAGGVWVSGHELPCEYPGSECTTPCRRVYVFTDVFVREAAAAPAREAGDA